ncbi:hypothetical protein GTO87_06900 [Ligilactobacillus saerimneri]|uniref:MucBP domain-containing protein n=1 Tax=Ligilactobacillus saerimneri TaxID=228229 RepID=A0A7H9ELS3_9LACO|nr:MucBP domain-containing protein [Ligilactobacillus saerimneri]QLL78339.1 hypothetical protein GTO87_06900 [Ligilactobacillus saerimneri]
MTIKYIDEEGTELVPSETIVGKVGDDYTTSSKVIDSYTIVKSPDNAVGKIAKESTLVVYISRQIINVVPKDYPTYDLPKDMTTDGTTLVPETTPTSYSSVQKEKTLPETGDASNGLKAVGITTLLAMLVLLQLGKALIGKTIEIRNNQSLTSLLIDKSTKKHGIYVF